MNRVKWFLPLLLVAWVLSGLVVAPGTGAQAVEIWSSPVNLSQDVADVDDASIALDQAGRVHVVWSANGELWHRYATGAAWSAAVRVAAGWSPRLAAGPYSQVHLAFVSRFEDNDEIYWTSWQAATGWQAPANVSKTENNSATPSLAVAPTGHLAVVWSEEAGTRQPIYIARSADGAAWAAGPLRAEATGTRPVVAFLSSHSLLVAWQNMVDPDYAPALEIWASRQAGADWTAPEAVSGLSLTDSSFAAAAVLGGQGYLAWEEEGDSGSVIQMSRMLPGGWSVAEPWSGADVASEPQVLFDVQGLGHLLWTAGQAVRHRAWEPTSGAKHAMVDVAVSQPGAAQVRAAAGNVVHAIWLRQVSLGNRDVWYSRQAEPTTPFRGLRLWLPLVRKP